MNLRSSLSVLLFVAFLFFLTLAPVDAQVTKQAPRNAGSISGRITIDGKPAAGLKVQLISIAPDGLSQSTPLSVATSKTGRYLFKGVTPGTYNVSPETTAFARTDRASDNPGKSVMIEPGETVTEINLDLLSKGSISGRITDSFGRPVVGEAVEYLLKRDDGFLQPASHPQPSDRSTDADGFYHTPGLAPGRYVVKVGIPYGLTAYGLKDEKRVRYRETFHPDVNESSKAVAVEVASSGETTNVDIRVGGPLTTHRISGQIISENGVRLPDIWLRVRAKSEDGKATSTLQGNYRSNDNGEFTIYGAMPGQYVVYPENEETSDLYGEPVSLEVNGSDVTGLKIIMHPALSITGIVNIEGSSNHINPEELSKLRIVAESILDEPQASGISVPIDSRGGFRIPGVHPGKVALALEDDTGGTPPGFKVLRQERNGVVTPEIEVMAGQNISGIKVVIGAGSGTIKGDVKIMGGELQGVRLFLYYGPAGSDPDASSNVELDARGHFVITDLIPGEYELEIGPDTAFLSGDGGVRTRLRMTTVKQRVNVSSGMESNVMLLLTLKSAATP